MLKPRFPNVKTLGACLALGLCLAASGCVRRTLVVQSDPAGARVFYNGEDKGVTPCRFEFYFYGQVEIKLVHPGTIDDGRPVTYEIYKEIVDVKAPWYEWPVLDFASEILWPFTIHDRRDLGTVKMNPLVKIPEGELIDKAEKLRAELQGSGPGNDSK